MTLVLSGHLPSASVQQATRETLLRPHLREGAVLTTLWDKHSLLRLLGLFQGLSPLQATLALASI